MYISSISVFDVFIFEDELVYTS